MRIKCIEKFEYELELPDGLNDVQINKQIWRVRDSLNCIADMTTPFWDGYSTPEFMEETFKWEKL